MGIGVENDNGLSDIIIHVPVNFPGENSRQCLYERNSQEVRKFLFMNEILDFN